MEKTVIHFMNAAKLVNLYHGIRLENGLIKILHLHPYHSNVSISRMHNLVCNTRKLATSDRWKRVYIDRDLTWTQRDEARKHDEKAKKDAESRTKEAEDEGKAVKYIAVGPRGKKRVISVPVTRCRGAGLDEGQT